MNRLVKIQLQFYSALIMTTNYPTTVFASQDNGVHWLLRTFYFIFIGSWFSLIWAILAWPLCISIIGLPIGLWMINYLPQVTTLSTRCSSLVVNASGHISTYQVEQASIFLRASYFLLIGWWLSAIWFVIAWALCITILGLPLGLWMLHRVPGVTTLVRS